MKRRNTVQKDLVLNAVQTLKCHATAEQVYNHIVKERPTVSKGTVYRNLGVLTDEGKIRRITVPGEADRYDHTTGEHYHVVCTRCGKTEDVVMPLLNLPDTVTDACGMKLFGCDVIFHGLCADCQRKEK